jgi:hypothetical protein
MFAEREKHPIQLYRPKRVVMPVEIRYERYSPRPLSFKASTVLLSILLTLIRPD